MTECFAPIEQYQRHGKFGAWTDVYALAATLYVLVTKQMPFPARFREHAPLVAPQKHNPELSDRINGAIVKGLELQPGDRPQSVKAWLEMLQPPQPKPNPPIKPEVPAQLRYVEPPTQPVPPRNIPHKRSVKPRNQPKPRVNHNKYRISQPFTRRKLLIGIGITVIASVGVGTLSYLSLKADISEQDSSQSISLSGAGASFPAPLYQRWFSEYNKQNPNVQVAYQSVGSGAGVEQFIQGTVDFGASDVAMKDEEIAVVERGVALLPMTAGSIVLAYNLPDVPELKLSRQAYVDILLGKIKKWNDPAIARLNSNTQLPDSNITVVHRSDGSGTTGLFTKHLSAISPEWSEKVGSGKVVEWATGIGAKGNEGVTAQILQTEGSLGYIEYGYAKQQEIPTATLENKAGKYVAPSSESASSALGATTLPENLRAFVTDPEGEDSYPIVTYTWILAYRTYEDEDKLKAFKNVINWSLTEGQSFAEELGYIPLPDNVVQTVQKKLDTIEAK